MHEGNKALDRTLLSQELSTYCICSITHSIKVQHSPVSVNFWWIWVLDFLQIPLPYSHLPPGAPTAPGPGETTHTQSSSSRRVKTAAVLQLNCDPWLSTWAIHSWAYVACTWAHLLKQRVSVSLLQPPFIQTLQTVHLVFLPLQGEPLSSVGAATESIKAYCVIVAISGR